MLVWKNKEARGDHLDGKKWAAGRQGQARSKSVHLRNVHSRGSKITC
jgi:hypothetical protein